MAPEVFALPRHVTGYGIDDAPHVVEQRRQDFVSWVRALAGAMPSPIREVPPTTSRPSTDTRSFETPPFDTASFDTVLVERSDQWLLHNRFVPLVGVLSVPPAPGPSWAVAGEFVDLVVPQHLVGWGPPVLTAETLNAELGPTDLAAFLPSAIEQADRYKPQTVGHVIFNYWT